MSWLTSAGREIASSKRNFSRIHTNYSRGVSARKRGRFREFPAAPFAFNTDTAYLLFCGELAWRRVRCGRNMTRQRLCAEISRSSSISNHR